MYDKKLLELIKKKQGMDVEQLCFYFNKTRPAIDRRIKELLGYGLVMAVRPFVRTAKNYFSSDFFREGETGEEARKRTAEQIKVTRDEFEKERDSKLNFGKI